MPRRASRAVVPLLVLLAAGVFAACGSDEGSADEGRADGGRTSVSSSSTASTTPSTTTSSTGASTTTRGDDRNGIDPYSGLEWVRVDDLPDEAFDTLVRIDDGGPFPFDRDGITFENREGLLPDESYGYYAEYTVITPGEDDRGARRIVAGAADDERYYTGDHYDSFVRVVWP